MEPWLKNGLWGWQSCVVMPQLAKEQPGHMLRGLGVDYPEAMYWR